MNKKVSREKMVKEITELVQKNIMISKIYLEQLTEATANPEGADYTQEARIIQIIYVVLTGNNVQLKRAIKKYQKNFPNASQINDFSI